MAEEAEDQKLKLAAEERKSAGEAEEQKLAAEPAELEAERKHKLELKKLQLERERLAEHGSATSEDQQMASSQAAQKNTIEKPKVLVLSGFVDGKDNLISYLLRYERYATVSCGMETI